MSNDELLLAAPTLEALAPGELSALGTNCYTNKPRMYLSSKSDANSRSVSRTNGSCEKTCLAEKFFVCLACIFE